MYFEDTRITSCDWSGHGVCEY